MVPAPAELDITTAPVLRDHVAELFAAGATSVVLDLAALRLVDSSGIGALVALTKRAKALGVELKMRNVGDGPATTFRISGTSSVLPLER